MESKNGIPLGSKLNKDTFYSSGNAHLYIYPELVVASALRATDLSPGVIHRINNGEFRKQFDCKLNDKSCVFMQERFLVLERCQDDYIYKVLSETGILGYIFLEA